MKDTKSRSVMNLEDRVLEYLKRNETTSVEQLYHSLLIDNPHLTRSEITDTVWRLTGTGKVTLEDSWSKKKSIIPFLGLWERLLWFYVSMIISFAAILAIYAIPADSELVGLRWLLGSVLVFFLPGYMAVKALFPKKSDLEYLERLLLSVGVSFALVMFIGLILNETMWGLTTLTPIATVLILLTVGLAAIALARQYAIA